MPDKALFRIDQGDCKGEMILLFERVSKDR